MRSAEVPPLRNDSSLVCLVDDEPAVRRGLTRLLRAARLDVRNYSTAEEFLSAPPPSGSVACLLVDLRMPGLSGLDLQDAMRARGMDLPVIFISGHADVRSGVQAMKSGAVDFLEKPVPQDALLAAIRRALASASAQQADSAEHALLAARAERLTPREKQVFVLVVTGRANKQVGAELGASEKTIKVHRSRVMEKMEAGSLADLVRMADRLGLGPARPIPAAPARFSSPALH